MNPFGNHVSESKKFKGCFVRENGIVSPGREPGCDFCLALEGRYVGKAIYSSTYLRKTTAGRVV